MTADRIVAVALLTQRDLDLLGPTFQWVWPVDETPCFARLLEAIDRADRELLIESDERRRWIGDREFPTPTPALKQVNTGTGRTR